MSIGIPVSEACGSMHSKHFWSAHTDALLEKLRAWHCQFYNYQKLWPFGSFEPLVLFFSEHNYYYSGAPLMQTPLGPSQSVMNRKMSSFKVFLYAQDTFQTISSVLITVNVHKAVFQCILYCTHNLMLSLLCTCCWTGGSHGCMDQQRPC